MENELKIVEYLEHPERSIDLEWVLDMLDRYPTFYLPAAMYIKRKPRGIDPEMMTHLHTAIVLSCPDRSALADFADITGNDWANLYPREELKDECSTDQAISTFIDTYGNRTDQEDELLERLIFNPVAPDYFPDTDEPYDPSDPLALPPELQPGYHQQPGRQSADTTVPEPSPETKAEEQQPPADTPKTAPKLAPLPSADTEKQPDTTPEHRPEPTPRQRPAAKPVQQPASQPQNVPQVTDDHSLMESLAIFFIKQQRFERAYEIISKLCLNYPEKSVYFADQMRFLRKVIINRRILKQNQEQKS